MFKRALTAILLLSTAFLATLAQPAQTRAAGPVTSAPQQYYLSLGDSVPYGYQQAKIDQELKATGTIDPTTFVGFADYFLNFLHSFNPSTQLVNMGCPGETTTTFINGGCSFLQQQPASKLHYQYTGSQLQAALAFLQAHPGQVSPITVFIGANDILGIVHACGAALDLACINQALPAILKTLQTNLATIVGALRQAAPTAEIILMNVYNPLAAVDPSTNALAQPVFQIWQGVAAATGAHYADLFTAFNLSQPQPQNICFLTNMCTYADVHPSDYGYLLISQVVEQASGYLSIGAGVPLSARVYVPDSLRFHGGPLSVE